MGGKQIEEQKRMLKEKHAEKLAEFIHCGQKRRNGEDFIEHTRRVANVIKDLGYGEDIVCASWLRDVGDYQFIGDMFHIIDKVFGYRVFGLVLLLTNFPKDASYNDYICKIADMSKDAMIIKWQDMIDDINGDIPKRQLEKYRDACIFLKSKDVEVPDILRKRFGI